ncbi:hypothetical protein P154DRAFT_580101 [Amniculicola lignicola CBS 123094]|uniref:Uncharacterized protein n=1 Tax=Amniculicola lignicola CBS 123094 TaxID=1392246 RepID=A0A6A5W522_9PLEO|nr:hypothetical protein P154DRAFT_580101 [Amniculicola lignicola CBS 123094]
MLLEALFLFLISPVAQAASSEAQSFAAAITPRAAPPPDLRQTVGDTPILQTLGADPDPNLIGYKEVDPGGTFSPLYCPSGYDYSASESYAACCYLSCRAPTACSSGTIIWPEEYSQTCGPGFPFCSTGTIRERYDATATLNSLPSRTMVWCAQKAEEWTAWKDIIGLKAVTDTNGNLMYIATTLPDASGTQSSATTTSGSPGSQTSSPSSTSMPLNGPQNSPSSSPLSSSSITASPSNSQKSNGLGVSTPALIGIIISASCSVIGLAFGVGFKVYKYREEQRRKKDVPTG